jgi:hypothetical protein
VKQENFKRRLREDVEAACRDAINHRLANACRVNAGLDVMKLLANERDPIAERCTTVLLKRFRMIRR